jgi:hypothetical protein
MVASQTVNTGPFLPVTVKAKTHVGKIDDRARNRHRGDISVASRTVDPCANMGLVLEMNHGSGGHDVHLPPKDGLPVLIVV